MLTSQKMAALATGGATIRKMFEEGALLKAQIGADLVYDFSIGNPDVPPPAALRETLIRILQENRPGAHGYMPNAGWPQVREQVAAGLTREQGRELEGAFTARHVVMTVGAAGALNIIFKAILDPGDEVVTPRPYFMEYNQYAENHGGRIVPAEPGPNFRLDVKAIGRKITPATRAVLINSPHNPTGVIYTAEELAGLGALLVQASQRNGRPVFLIADEPYRKLAYGGRTVPAVFPAYTHTIVATSHSKDLSVPGERIGYAAINPDLPGSKPLFEALATANRILGFVSAPSLMQLALGELQGTTVDVALYERRRDLFVGGLKAAGYDLTVPEGAFYLFPKSPIADDTAFVELLKEENILAVPGRLFGQPGHFRLSYCVSETTIANSLPGFIRALEKACAQAA